MRTRRAIVTLLATAFTCAGLACVTAAPAHALQIDRNALAADSCGDGH